MDPRPHLATDLQACVEKGPVLLRRNKAELSRNLATILSLDSVHYKIHTTSFTSAAFWGPPPPPAADVICYHLAPSILFDVLPLFLRLVFFRPFPFRAMQHPFHFPSPFGAEMKMCPLLRERTSTVPHSADMMRSCANALNVPRILLSLSLSLSLALLRDGVFSYAVGGIHFQVAATAQRAG